MKDKFIWTEKELPQKSPEWVKMRETCIGASDLAEILGIKGDARKLYKRKTGQTKPKKMTAAIENGEQLERKAIEEVKKVLKSDYKAPKFAQYFAKHPNYPYIGVSFDGVDVKNKFITEVKCPLYAWNFRTVWEDGIQDHYYPQVQLQLAVANAHWGITKAYFASYFPKGAYIIDNIEYKEHLKTLCVIDEDYDPDYIEYARPVIKKFWDMIQGGEWDEEGYRKVLDKFNEKFKVCGDS